MVPDGIPEAVDDLDSTASSGRLFHSGIAYGANADFSTLVLGWYHQIDPTGGARWHAGHCQWI